LTDIDANFLDVYIIVVVVVVDLYYAPHFASNVLIVPLRCVPIIFTLHVKSNICIYEVGSADYCSLVTATPICIAHTFATRHFKTLYY